MASSFNRVILAGIGYSSDVQSVAALGWTGAMSYHMYPNWIPAGQQTPLA